MVEWRTVETLLQQPGRQSFIDAYQMITAIDKQKHSPSGLSVAAVEEARIRLVFANKAHCLASNLDATVHQQIESAQRLLTSQRDQSTEEWAELYFGSTSLQAEVYHRQAQPSSVSTARNILRKSLGEAEKRQNWLWIYWLQLKLVQLEPRGALRRLSESAKKARNRGDLQVSRLFSLYQVTILLSAGELGELDKLQVLPLISTIVDDDEGKKSDSLEPSLLDIWASIVGGLVCNYYGNSTGAQWHLNRLLGQMQQVREQQQQPICLAVNGYRSPLQLDWLRWAELDALVNLLAGQTKMGDVSLAPAKQFLQQGLQKLSPTAAESADGDEIMQSIVKCGLLSETVNLLMLRSRADDAQAVVEQWRSSLVPISAAAPWADEWLRQSRISLRLSEAELLQCRSEFQQAVDCYETILTDIKSECRCGNEFNDLSVYCLLQLAFIYLCCEGGLDQRPNQTLNILDRLRPLATASQSSTAARLAVQVAVHLIEGLWSLRRQQYHQTKVHLLEALRLCSSATAQLQQTNTALGGANQQPSAQFKSNQLKIFTLVILGRLYAVTNNAQSLKMFEAASGLAVKMRSDTLCRLTSELMRNNEFDL